MQTGTQVLAITSGACFIAALLVLVRLHLLPTGNHPLQSAVSDYGAGAYHRYYRTMVVLLGLGAGLLLAGLIRDSEARTAGLVFLGAFAGARIAIAFFRTDLPGEAPTPTGRVHVVLAAVAFTAIAFAASDLTAALEGSPGWSGDVAGVLRFESRAVVLTAVLTMVAYLVPLARDRVFGLVERLLYLAMLAWLLTASIHLATLAGGGL